MPLNHTLRKCTCGYKLSKSQEKINHLMYMDDIKQFTKNEKEMETLMHTVVSQDIGIEFGNEKFAMLIIKSGKRHITGGMKQPNQEKNRNAQRKGNVQVLGNIRSWRHQSNRDERKKLKRGEKDLPAWKIALTHRYNDSKTT